MRKILVCLCVLCLLTGCTGSFDYNKAVDDLINRTVEKQEVFHENKLEAYTKDKSFNYKQLLNLIYNSADITLVSASGADVAVTVSMIDKDSVTQIAMSDITGFVSDIKNLYAIGMSQDEIDNYVYDYLFITYDKYYKKSYPVTLELTQCSEEPLQFVDNGSILNVIDENVTTIVTTLCNEVAVLEDDNTEDSTTVIQEAPSLELNKIKPINYYCDGELIPITVKFTKKLENFEATDRLLELSEGNSSILYSNLCYIEYEVCNYGDKPLLFSSKVFDADSETFELFDDSLNYFGVLDSVLVEPGSTTLIMDVVAINHGDLVWYDDKARELYMLNLE